MNPSLKWFSTVGLFALSACAVVWEAPSRNWVILSLGGERVLTSVGSLPVGYPHEIGLRVETLDGNLVQSLTFTQPASSYELSVDLPPNQLFRAVAYHRNIFSWVSYLDTKIFSADRPVVHLRLGHVARLVFYESFDSSFQNSFPVNFDDDPRQFQQASFNVVQDYVRFSFEVPAEHQDSLTTFEYRVDEGAWTPAAVGVTPVFQVPENTQKTLRVRYRQESDGQWIVRQYLIIHDT